MDKQIGKHARAKWPESSPLAINSAIKRGIFSQAFFNA
jgi:hypothetical protein